MLKILYVITSLEVGGAERQVVDLARQMASEHQICICYLTGEQQLSMEGSGVEILGLNLQKNLLSFFNACRKLRSLISEFRPDVVHSHMVHANLLSRFLRLTVSFPVLVCSAHNVFEGGRLRMLAYRLTDGFANLTTNVSQEAVMAFEEKRAVPKGTMQVVSNGVDTDIFRYDIAERNRLRIELGATDSDVILLSIGRLVKAKDFPNLLRAFSSSLEIDRRLKLWIVGDGEEKANLLQLAATLGLQYSVRFLGMRHDVAALHNVADVFVLSSAWEGFGLVVAEAMATERVVVATDCGGVREVLGGYGYLVAPRNHTMLAEHIGKALKLSFEEKAQLGRSARARVVETLSLTRAVEVWVSIYESLLMTSNEKT